MSKIYVETEQTMQALINLGADRGFVSFNMIFNEVKNIRLARGHQKSEDKNTRGRVRRSLVYNKNTAALRNSEQGNKLSISIKYPDYIVKSEKAIQFFVHILKPISG